MKLIQVASSCGGGVDCPTVHATDRGTVVVQGYVVDDAEVLGSLHLPDGEGAVEIPVSLLLASAARFVPRSSQ
jgi:hypothetical protein